MAPTGVLFFQSQEFFGADSQIQASLMTHLPRDEFDVHCAIKLAPGTDASPSAAAVSRIDDVQLRNTEFGPNFERDLNVRNAFRAAWQAVRAARSLVALAVYVRRNEIDIVHCTEKPRDAFYGSLVARVGGAQQVIHVHVKSEQWIRAVVRRAMHRAPALVGVSDFVSESLVDSGYDARRVHTVLNGLELDNWPDAAVDTTRLRSELDLDPEALVLLSVSRLFRWKGQHLILEALPEVCKHFPDVRLLIVGADDPRADQATESYSDELRTMAVDLDVGDNVVFTGWRTDVRELMALADVYVMPSFEEPFGMVYVEAMAMRRPVVALDNGGAKEVVDDGGSGLLSAVGDTAGLAENLVRLLSDRALRERMGEHGRKRVVDHFGAVRMTDDVARLYRHLVGQSKRGQRRTRRAGRAGSRQA